MSLPSGEDKCLQKEKDLQSDSLKVLFFPVALGAAGNLSDSVESLLDVGKDVLDVLDSDGETDEVRSNTGFAELFV